MNLWSKLREGLARTSRQMRSRLQELVGPAATVGGDRPVATAVGTLEAVEEALIGADVGVAATRVIMERLRQAGSSSDVLAVVKAEILRLLREVDRPPAPGGSPRVVVVVGVNGTGKTTTVAKLAALARTSGESPLICAADTFRAAAIEQLEVWAERAGVEVVRARPGGDPAAVVFDAIAAARVRGRSPVLVDTAGRLHTRAPLMEELAKIRRVAAREVAGAPHDVLLVLDATVGQNGVVQAREFLEHAGVTGVVLTKLDGTARGGVAVAVATELRLPVRFVGVGEQLDDLLPFSPQAYVDALFDAPW